MMASGTSFEWSGFRVRSWNVPTAASTLNAVLRCRYMDIVALPDGFASSGPDVPTGRMRGVRERDTPRRQATSPSLAGFRRRRSIVAAWSIPPWMARARHPRPHTHEPCIHIDPCRLFPSDVPPIGTGAWSRHEAFPEISVGIDTRYETRRSRSEYPCLYGATCLYSLTS